MWYFTWLVKHCRSLHLETSHVVRHSWTRPKSDCWLLYTSSGWWFATFVIFPNSWDDDPIWQIFFGGVETTNQPCISHYYIPKNSFPKLCLPLPSVKRENFMPHHPVFQCSFLGQPWCMANVAGWKKTEPHGMGQLVIIEGIVIPYNPIL